MTANVLFDRPDASYLAGEALHGRVVIDNSDHSLPMDHERITVKIYGYEQVSWKRKKVSASIGTDDAAASSQKNDEETDGKKSHYFLKTQVVLCEAGVMQPGTHTFCFGYPIPVDSLPSCDTYESRFRNGSYDYYDVASVVHYSCEVIGCRPGMFTSNIRSSETPFRVRARHLKVSTPVEASGSKTFMFAKGELRLLAEMQRNVFFPGDTILMDVTVNNGSSKKVTSIKEAIHLDKSLRTASGRQHFSSEVTSKLFQGVPGGRTLTEQFAFVVPHDLPTVSVEGKLVRHKYMVTLTCNVEMAFCLSVNLPIFIAYAQPLDQPIPPVPKIEPPAAPVSELVPLKGAKLLKPFNPIIDTVLFKKTKYYYMDVTSVEPGTILEIHVEGQGRSSCNVLLRKDQLPGGQHDHKAKDLSGYHYHMIVTPKHKPPLVSGRYFLAVVGAQLYPFPKSNFIITLKVTNVTLGSKKSEQRVDESITPYQPRTLCSYDENWYGVG